MKGQNCMIFVGLVQANVSRMQQTDKCLLTNISDFVGPTTLPHRSSASPFPGGSDASGNNGGL